MSLSSFISHFFSAVNNVPLSVGSVVSLFSHLSKDMLVAFKF